jgi:hypothetical protein
VLQLPREVRLLREVLLLQLRRRSQRRRKRRKRSQTRIWASVYSTKNLRAGLFERVEKKTLRLLDRRIPACKENTTFLSLQPAHTASFSEIKGALGSVSLR